MRVSQSSVEAGNCHYLFHAHSALRRVDIWRGGNTDRLTRSQELLRDISAVSKEPS